LGTPKQAQSKASIMGKQKVVMNPIYEIVVEGETWKYRRKRVNWGRQYVIFISPVDGKEQVVQEWDIVEACGLLATWQLSKEHLVQYVCANRERLVRKKAKGERNLTIGKEVWGWRVGKKNVLITAPSGKKTAVPFMVSVNSLVDYEKMVQVGDEIFVKTGITTELNHCCECCGEPDGTTRDVALPSVVREYIESHRADLV
jgi:hypothetical protein